MKTKYAAFLRGINVGGHRKIKMADLRELLEAEGCESVSTYLQSGNAVFLSDLPKDKLELKIEKAIETRFGFEVLVLLRTPKRVVALIENNPFPCESDEDFKKLYTIHVEEIISELRWQELVFPETIDEAILDGDCIYLFSKSGYGKTKIGNQFFEKKLKVRSTARNWRTLNAVARMLEEL